MKPIFEEEREFLRSFNINIPENCWKDGSKIYYTPYDTIPAYTLFVKDNNVLIKKDRTKAITWTPMSLESIIEKEKERVLGLEKEAIDFLNSYTQESGRTTFSMAYSGGKDSDVLLNLLSKTSLKYMIHFCNTSNETAQTYLHVKKKLEGTNHVFLNPSEGYYQWIYRKGFIPTRLVRNCCSTYKEGQISKYFDPKQPLFTISGVRAYESAKRSSYKRVMDHDTWVSILGKSNQPKPWTTIAPIVDWTDLDVWVYLLLYNIGFNQQYRYGFERCGCLICPYQTDYTDLLIEHFYPSMWKRWMQVLSDCYDTMYVERNYKYTLEEWQNHKWKYGTSKEFELTQRTPTKDRVAELAKIKGVSEDVAQRYFKRTCFTCEKKLNPNEVAMNLKYFGTNTNALICKKCFCDEYNINTKEYNKQVREFRDGGCKLF